MSIISPKMHMLAPVLLFLWFPIVVAAADGGDDFSNNLFNDLAPLIALFGEQVAKQYLSQSFHWLEHVIFACAPLGILTAVTCAIRVAGSNSMKAVIGRARESEAQAEIEIMSSTSGDVCELWNGTGIVRVAGSPDILQLLYDRERAGCGPEQSQEGNTDLKGVYALEQAMEITTDQQRADIETPLRVVGAPNISLNTSNARVSPTEFMVVAFIGICLQAGVLVLDGAATYYSGLHWKKGGVKMAGYAFPLTCIGTLAIVAGMFLCAYVIEASTVEHEWKMRESVGNDVQILWIQRGKTVNDQGFGSYVVYAARERNSIMTSRPDKHRKLHLWTNVGTVLSIGGFVLQFVGLRGMHFSASISQLVATFIMTILRVYLRRNLTAEPKQYKENEIPSGEESQFSVKQLPQGRELDFVANQMAHCKDWKIVTYERAGEAGSAEGGGRPDAVSRVFQIRLRLSRLAGLGWHGETHTAAAKLAETIDELMKHIWDHMVRASESKAPSKSFKCKAEVALVTDSGGNLKEEGAVELGIERQEIDDRWTPWKTNQVDIDAIFSLWMSRLEQLRLMDPDTSLMDPDTYLWLFNFSGTNDKNLGRIICDWWISQEPDSIEFDETSFNSSRILTCIPNKISTPGSLTYGIVNTTSLSKMCSQYILSAFLAAAAIWIEPITSETDISVREGSRLLKAANKDVNALADIIRRSELATWEDAYRIVVPALFEENRLPDLLDNKNIVMILGAVKSAPPTRSDYEGVVCARLRSLCMHKTRKMVHKGKWTDAGKLCLGLVGHLSRELGPENGETIRMRRSMKEFGNQLVSAAQSHTSRSNVQSRTNGVQYNRTNFPLHHAIQNGMRDEVYEILQGEAQGVDCVCEKGITPLGLAASQEDIYFVQLLLFFGANASGLEKSERSPLQLAVGTGPHGFNPDMRDVVELLLLSGANINLGEPTPLQEAITACPESIAIYLIEEGADFNHVDSAGTSAIHLAAAAGLESVVNLLLEKGVNPDLRDEHGFSVIHYAVVAGEEGVVRQLLENKANPNLADSTGRTALHWAVGRGVEAIVKLLEKGVD